VIVHVITGLGRGGAEGALFRLLSATPDAARCKVVSLGDSGLFGPRLEQLGVEVVALGMNPRRPSPLALLRLARLLRRWRPQLVQTWMYHADLLGGIAARLAGVPVCWGIRQSDLSPLVNKASTRLIARLCALLSRRVPARIVSCSQKAAEVHRALGYAAPFVVVPNGLDVREWQPRPELREAVRRELGLGVDEFVFAHAGRADPQKDHGNLARAFSLLPTGPGRPRLLLCGKGLGPSDPYQQALPFSAEARSALVALGERDDLPRLWQAADAFILSSSGEAFPNVLAEAMACGLPCVTTDVGDAGEIVGQTGRVVPAGDAPALARAMQSLRLLAPHERQALGRAARQRIEARYTLERMATGFRDVWNDVIREVSTPCAD
jgi:glycosyltransferase involved in cell wall biosynthesis